MKTRVVQFLGWILASMLAALLYPASFLLVALRAFVIRDASWLFGAAALAWAFLAVRHFVKLVTRADEGEATRNAAFWAEREDEMEGK